VAEVMNCLKYKPVTHSEGNVWIMKKCSFAAKQPFKATVRGRDLSNATHKDPYH
jgi:hypothetical protein